MSEPSVTCVGVCVIFKPNVSDPPTDQLCKNIRVCYAGKLKEGECLKAQGAIIHVCHDSMYVILQVSKYQNVRQQYASRLDEKRIGKYEKPM